MRTHLTRRAFIVAIWCVIVAAPIVGAHIGAAIAPVRTGPHTINLSAELDTAQVVDTRATDIMTPGRARAEADIIRRYPVAIDTLRLLGNGELGPCEVGFCEMTGSTAERAADLARTVAWLADRTLVATADPILHLTPAGMAVLRAINAPDAG